MARPLVGGCACGAVRYESALNPMEPAAQRMLATSLATVNCYCRDCQRSSGTAMTSIIVVPKKYFRFTKGRPKLFGVTADSGRRVYRGFCAECGSPLISEGQDSEWIAIKAGSLDDPSQFRPTANFYVESAPPWALFAEGIRLRRSFES
jgi:hypothetical protein